MRKEIVDEIGHPAVALYDTVIVGAGIAGLSAARLLARDGRSVLVLEARDRIGGRVWTSRSDGDVLDLGASWIHGVDGNPLADAVAAYGIDTTEFTVGSYQPDGRPIAYYSPDATRLGDESVALFASDVHAFGERYAGVASRADPRTSFGEVAEAVFAQLDWDDNRIDRVREFVRHRTEEQAGAWIDELDAHGLDDDAIEGDEVVFPHGYDELALRLADGLDIRLEHVVTQVRWSRNAGVTIVTDRGTFTAARAVITVPVGVLKSSEFVFDPPLPDRIADALEGLEMNAFEKVFLRFPRMFWDEDVYAIRRQGETARWWHSWYDVTPLQGPPTLLTFAAGPSAQETRTWSDSRIAESVLEALREIYGDRVLTPDRVHVTRWQDDRYSRGSYSYMTVGSHASDHDALAAPVDGVLHLAGEATWTDDPATVTAALCSGHRAAEHILGRAVQFHEIWESPESESN